MPRISAGILIYRVVEANLEVLLVHPGGPFWKNRDLGAWTIPKGEAEEGEDFLATAHRELREETGFEVSAEALPLGHVKQSGGKTVYGWALAADVDPSELQSNCFEMEWPRGSNQIESFPEVDKAQWFGLEEAHRRINSAQRAFLDVLASEIENQNEEGSD